MYATTLTKCNFTKIGDGRSTKSNTMPREPTKTSQLRRHQLYYEHERCNHTNPSRTKTTLTTKRITQRCTSPQKYRTSRNPNTYYVSNCHNSLTMWITTMYMPSTTTKDIIL